MARIEQALEWLERALARVPEVKSSLREPVSASDLDALRKSVAPHQLPGELVRLLQWADGQALSEPHPWAPAWPGLEDGSSLLPAAEMAHQYQFRRSPELAGDWPPLLLPIGGEQLSQTSLELVPDRPGVLVSTPYDGPMQVAAPSLVAMLNATSALLESGHPADAEQWTGEQGYAGWYSRRHEILRSSYATDGWDHWGHGFEVLSSPKEWPPHWRA